MSHISQAVRQRQLDVNLGVRPSESSRNTSNQPLTTLDHYGLAWLSLACLGSCEFNTARPKNLSLARKPPFHVRWAHTSKEKSPPLAFPPKSTTLPLPPALTAMWTTAWIAVAQTFAPRATKGSKPPPRETNASPSEASTSLAEWEETRAALGSN